MINQHHAFQRESIALLLFISNHPVMVHTLGMYCHVHRLKTIASAAH